MIPDAERRRLLQVARETVEAAVGRERREVPREPAVDVQGAFVTLRRRSDHDLRGCVGSLRPASEGLPRLIADAARSAALHDDRFDRITPAEVPELEIEISILGPLQPIRPDQVEIGRHGLVLRAHGRGGLLLPQVPEEHGMDRAAFLDAICRKAGLPPRAYELPDAQLLGFEAEVFAEE